MHEHYCLLLGLLLILTQNIVCRNIQDTFPEKPSGAQNEIKLGNTTRNYEAVRVKRGDELKNGTEGHLAPGVTRVGHDVDKRSRSENISSSLNRMENLNNIKEKLSLGSLPLFARAANFTSKPSGAPLTTSKERVEPLYEFAPDMPNKLHRILDIIANRQNHDFLDLFDKMKETGTKIGNTTIPKLKEFFHEKKNKSVEKQRSVDNVQDKKASNNTDVPIYGGRSVNFSSPQNVIRSIFDKINYLRMMAANSALMTEAEEKIPNATVLKGQTEHESEILSRSKHENKTRSILVGSKGGLDSVEQLLFLRKMKRDLQKNMGNENLSDKEIFVKEPYPEMKNGIYNVLVRPKIEGLIHKPQDSIRNGVEEVAVGFEIKYQDCDKNKVLQNKLKNMLTEDSVMDQIFKTTKKMLKFIANLNEPMLGMMNRTPKSPESNKKIKIFDILNISKSSGLMGKWNKSKIDGTQIPGQDDLKTFQNARLNESRPQETVLQGTPCKRAVKPTKLCKMMCKLYNYTSGRCNEAGFCTCSIQRSNDYLQYLVGGRSAP